MGTLASVLALAAGLALVVTLESCGGCDNPTDPGCGTPSSTTTTTLPPCSQSNVYTDSGPVPSSTLFFHDFPVTNSGRLDMTLDWTNATSLMGLYLVPAGTCTLDEFNRRACNFIVRSEPPGPKPRRVSASNFQAGNYRVLIANFSPADESAALQLLLSTPSCPAVTGIPPAAAAHDATSPLAVGRAERR